jgi:hypothetical protein
LTLNEARVQQLIFEAFVRIDRTNFRPPDQAGSARRIWFTDTAQHRVDNIHQTTARPPSGDRRGWSPDHGIFVDLNKEVDRQEKLTGRTLDENEVTVATWGKNGGSCSATPNAIAAPDCNTTADTITAVTAMPVIQQQVAGLASGGQYTFYIWGKVASGTRQVSIAIVDNACAGYLAGPTSITLTTAWQRFKISGTLAGGQTGLWIVVRQFAGNGDNWTSGAIYLWGACLQQGNDPKNGYARTWAFQTANIAVGMALRNRPFGSTVLARISRTTDCLRAPPAAS